MGIWDLGSNPAWVICWAYLSLGEFPRPHIYGGGARYWELHGAEPWQGFGSWAPRRSWDFDISLSLKFHRILNILLCSLTLNTCFRKPGSPSPLNPPPIQFLFQNFIHRVYLIVCIYLDCLYLYLFYKELYPTWIFIFADRIRLEDQRGQRSWGRRACGNLRPNYGHCHCSR